MTPPSRHCRSQCGRGLAPDGGGSVHSWVTDTSPSGASPLPHFQQCQALAEVTASSTASGRLISAYTSPVNTLPATIASKYSSAWFIAFGVISTNKPPWGAASLQPKYIDSAPANAPPAMLAGITRSGSLAANGIAPSEIKHRPRIIAALPASRSVWANLRRARKVAIPIPIGGTIPAAMVAAIGAPLDAASKPTENAYAALLIGPPRSTHIMPPSRMPSSTALVVPIVLRKSVRPVSNRATGGPTR